MENFCTLLDKEFGGIEEIKEFVTLVWTHYHKSNYEEGYEVNRMKMLVPKLEKLITKDRLIMVDNPPLSQEEGKEIRTQSRAILIEHLINRPSTYLSEKFFGENLLSIAIPHLVDADEEAEVESSSTERTSSTEKEDPETEKKELSSSFIALVFLLIFLIAVLLVLFLFQSQKRRKQKNK
jgi:hypothetical protein